MLLPSGLNAGAMDGRCRLSSEAGERSVESQLPMDTCPKKQRIPAQTENEGGENGEYLVAGERFRKDVKTAKTT
jgi:hypothetical protein